MSAKPLKETIDLIRKFGGEDVVVSTRTRHHLVEFTAKGNRSGVLVHRGAKVNSRFAPMIRSELRKAGLAVT